MKYKVGDRVLFEEKEHHEIVGYSPERMYYDTICHDDAERYFISEKSLSLDKDYYFIKNLKKIL